MLNNIAKVLIADKSAGSEITYQLCESVLCILGIGFHGLVFSFELYIVQQVHCQLEHMLALILRREGKTVLYKPGEIIS